MPYSDGMSPNQPRRQLKTASAIALIVLALMSHGCSSQPSATSEPTNSAEIVMATQLPRPYTSEEICSAELKAAYDGTKKEANFQNCNFVWANFMLADFSGDDFSGANLNLANLGLVNFRGATLSGASLRNADLRGSDLRGADLTGVDFTGANLRKALIADRQFVTVILCRTTLPDGFVTERNC